MSNDYLTPIKHRPATAGLRSLRLLLFRTRNRTVANRIAPKAVASRMRASRSCSKSRLSLWGDEPLETVQRRTEQTVFSIVPIMVQPHRRCRWRSRYHALQRVDHFDHLVPSMSSSSIQFGDTFAKLAILPVLCTQPPIYGWHHLRSAIILSLGTASQAQRLLRWTLTKLKLKFVPSDGCN